MGGEVKVELRSLPITEYFESGHTACPGCGNAMAVRQAMKILGEKTIVVIPAGCLIVFGSTYPFNSWRVPFIHVAFENTAAVASGIAAALKIKGVKDVNVVGIAGDGGTYDIGIQALSGAAERGDNILYICINNEAYMNTGIQGSSATPYGAWTTTTPIGELIKGKAQHRKDMPRIMACHEIPYTATATIAYWRDYIEKVAKAKTYSGCRYIETLCPCPTGWRFPSSETVKLSRLAVETGMWALWEKDRETFKFTGLSKAIAEGKMKRKPVAEYLKLQGRFRHLTNDDIKLIQEWLDALWTSYIKLAK